MVLAGGLFPLCILCASTQSSSSCSRKRHSLRFPSPNGCAGTYPMRAQRTSVRLSIFKTSAASLGFKSCWLIFHSIRVLLDYVQPRALQTRSNTEPCAVQFLMPCSLFSRGIGQPRITRANNKLFDGRLFSTTPKLCLETCRTLIDTQEHHKTIDVTGMSRLHFVAPG